MDTKLSNVIGAPFNPIVLRQLGIRVANNSTLTRTQDQVLFMANKMAWVKLTSSVNIVFPFLQPGNSATTNNDLNSFYRKLNLDPNNYKTPDALAKSWVLQAGTSIQNGDGINLRQGIGPNGAYGLGGTEELGYRPMPGLTSVQVQTMGTLGSLRQATISFKVWNMDQLNIIEALYFRLGYSMLLEWGHVQYFNNTGGFVNDKIFGITDPFASNKRKEQVQQEIARKARKTAGNYDGMLGIVSNFNWTFNQSGGYDCTIRLIGLGAIMDSLRIDQSYALPPGLVKRFKKDLSLIEAAEIDEKKVDTTDPNTKPPEPLVKENPPKNKAEAQAIVAKYDNFKGDATQFTNTYSVFRLSNQKPLGLSNQTAFIDLTLGRSIQDVSQDAIKEAKTKFDGFWNFFPDRAVRVKPVKEGEPVPVTFNLKLIDAYIETFFQQNPDRQKTTSNNGTFVYADPFLQYIQRGTDTSGDSRDPVVRNVDIDTLFRSKVDQYTTTFNEAGVQGPAEVTVPNGTGREVDFTFSAGIKILNPDPDYPATRREVLKALRNALNTATVNGIVTKLEKNGNFVEYAGNFTWRAEIPVKAGLANRPATKAIDINFRFTTNNPTFIISSSDVVPTAPPKPAVSKPNDGDASGDVNKADTEQIEAPRGFQSALHAMLTVVRAEVQAKESAKEGPNIAAVDILKTTQQFYSSGILKGVLKLETNGNVSVVQAADTGGKGLPFDVTGYALKGFNSELMIDPGKYDQVPNVDFKKLCTAFIIKYPKVGADGTKSTVQVPVYISLGYLLAFLNNMCLIYDSTTLQNPNQPQTGEQRPYFYIDFNPETNFCLTSPQQFSIDPTTCMIPLEASPEDYQAIFPDNVKIQDKSSKVIVLNDKGSTPFFDPSKENGISAELTKKGAGYRATAYQGKVMNILLNIDYLLNIASSFQASDTEHAVNLQAFIERIMVDVNKSLGNMNLFRVAYRDDANTIQVLDSQWVPNLAIESSILKKGTVDPDSRAMSGVIPVFDSGSLAREFQLKTVISTKLASVVAISAQAATGSVNSKDHSSFSWLNQNFQDRYKPYIQDPSNGASGASNAATKEKEDSNEVKAAALFNSHVKNIYDANSIAAITDKIELSKNYYIERISKVKSSDPVTVSAPFIPADLEISIDGISGIIMGNAFLIPEERLPLSLRGENGFPKIGFVVTNLTNTIENNQWITKFKGQMIKLRDYDGFRKLAEVAGTIGKPSVNTGSGGSRRLQGVGAGCTRSSSTAIENAKTNIDSLKKVLANNGLNSTTALASVLAIVGGESRWDGSREEDFRYSPARLSQVFPNLTADQNARAVAAKTRKEFFSIVYGEYRPDRVGNRNVQDGGLYYGRGYLQLTGYGNYKKYGDLIGVDLVNKPELAADPDTAAKITAAYIKDRVKLDINSPDYFETAVYAVGNPVDPEVKVGYYNCLLGQV